MPKTDFVKNRRARMPTTGDDINTIGDIIPFDGFTENAFFKFPLSIPKESENLLFFRGKIS
jgi:hypothetical protein